jgi:hypothetical protein
MKKVYIVDLTKEEKTELSKPISKGELRARKLNRAHILLSANEGVEPTSRSQRHCAHHQPLHRRENTPPLRRRRALEPALNESPPPGGKRKLDGHQQEAYAVALACSEPPEGKKRWSMQLLADKLVEVGVLDEISDETLRRTLKRGASSRG